MKINANIRTETIKATVYRGVYRDKKTYESYNGTYEVIPKAASQELKTANKLLEENIKVLAIPFAEVSNENGTTVIIG